MIASERASFNDFDTPPSLQGWIVRGPEGQFYGRYKNYPTPSQIPLYAVVEKEKPGFRMTLGNDGEDGGSVF
jgi:hypothetical protein